MYYLSMVYPNHEDIIFESEDLDLVEYEYRMLLTIQITIHANDIEYYEIWSDNGSIITTFSDIYTEGLRSLSVGFTPTIVHLIYHNHVPSVSNVESSMVKDIKVDAGKSLAIVEYNSGAKYAIVTLISVHFMI